MFLRLTNYHKSLLLNPLFMSVHLELVCSVCRSKSKFKFEIWTLENPPDWKFQILTDTHSKFGQDPDRIRTVLSADVCVIVLYKMKIPMYSNVFLSWSMIHGTLRALKSSYAVIVSCPFFIAACFTRFTIKLIICFSQIRKMTLVFIFYFCYLNVSALIE